MKFRLSASLLSLLFPFIMRSQTLLQDLPKLNDHSVSFSQSTYDRTGKNDDRLAPEYSNFYDRIPQGQVNNPGGTAGSRKEYVICNVNGPAIVERFWVITFPFHLTARFRFYFDGESIPRINKTFSELFVSQTPPFVKPLVQNLAESSGGFWSYLELPVSKSLMVTIDTAAAFCQFGIRQLPRDTMVESWTPAHSSSYLSSELNKSGSYPKNNAASLFNDSTVISLLPNQPVMVYNTAGEKVIESIKILVPELDFTYSELIKDKGNFHKGTSRFNMKVNGNSNAVWLIKRSNKFNHLDFNFNNLFERAIVRIDNATAGTWENRGYRTYRYWKDDSFLISKSLYQGKTQVAVQVQYTAGDPWNEYTYWISCDGIITDSLDVDMPASETAHAYSVNNLQANLYEEIVNRYDAPESVKKHNQRLLDSLQIIIYFDDETISTLR